jgi:CRISPR-associated protein Csm3
MSLQNGTAIRFLHGHVIISGVISCKTGIFIGGADDILQIGGIDKNVVRNPLTGEPYIPGSSLKGKLRSITEKIVKDAKGNPLLAKRTGGDKGRKVWRHECDDYNAAKDCKLCRIFGSTGSGTGNDNFPGALLVRDGTLSNRDELMQDGLHVTEIKMENAIDRLTAAAHPRTFERVPAGAKFKFELVYRVETLEPDPNNVNGNVAVDSERVKDDITNLLNAMELLEKDGLGGNISRGYGSIKFEVNIFQGYDTKNNKKGGFSEEGTKPLSSCKGKISEITFAK